MADVQSCPRCGTELDDEQFCSDCGEQITDQEIAEHEQQWGELYVRYWDRPL